MIFPTNLAGSNRPKPFPPRRGLRGTRRLAGDPCGGLSRVAPRNIVLAPDRFTDVSSSEIVEAKIERLGQLVSFEGKLNTKAETCKIVNRAMVYGLILNQDLAPWYEGRGSRRLSGGLGCRKSVLNPVGPGPHRF